MIQQSIGYLNTFLDITHSECMNIFTPELIQLTIRKTISPNDTLLIKEQNEFLDFVRDVAQRKPKEKILLSYKGKFVKVGILFVKCHSIEKFDSDLEDCVESIRNHDLNGLDSVYLLAVGSLNSKLAADAIKEYSDFSDYNISWKRHINCPKINNSVIFRISKISDIDVTGLSYTELDDYYLDEFVDDSDYLLCDDVQKPEFGYSDTFQFILKNQKIQK